MVDEVSEAKLLELRLEIRRGFSDLTSRLDSHFRETRRLIDQTMNLIDQVDAEVDRAQSEHRDLYLGDGPDESPYKH